MTDLQKALDYAKAKKVKDLESFGNTKVYDGSLTVNENLAVKGSISTNNGSYLFLSGGESVNMYDKYKADFGDTEIVSAVAESGLQIISSPSNWINADGNNGQYTDADWAKKNIATINNSKGDSSLPGGLSIGSAISDGEGTDSHIALYADSDSDYTYISYHRDTGKRAWESGMSSDHNKWFLRGKDTNSTNAKDLLVANYSENTVHIPNIQSESLYLTKGLEFSDTNKWIAKTASSGWGIYWSTDNNGEYAKNEDSDNNNKIIYVGTNGTYKSSIDLDTGYIDTVGNIGTDGYIKADNGAFITATPSNPFRLKRSINSTDGDDIVNFHVDDSGLIIDIDNENDSDSGNIAFRRKTGGNDEMLMLINPSETRVYKDLKVDGEITESSDERIKENIETLENSLDKVKLLRGVSYNKIGESNQEVGFIAQEVQEVLPEIVREDKEEMLSVSYARTVALLVEAIKEQQEQIEKLKSRIEDLEGEK